MRTVSVVQQIFQLGLLHILFQNKQLMYPPHVMDEPPSQLPTPKSPFFADALRYSFSIFSKNRPVFHEKNFYTTKSILYSN